jgi:hypothetical protein
MNVFFLKIEIANHKKDAAIKIINYLLKCRKIGITKKVQSKKKV